MNIPKCKFCHLHTLILFQIKVIFIVQKKKITKGLEQHEG